MSKEEIRFKALEVAARMTKTVPIAPGIYSMGASHYTAQLSAEEIVTAAKIFEAYLNA